MIDTGAASTIVNADLAADAGVYVIPTDTLRRLRGVGGHEHVFTRHVDRFAVGDHGIDGFELEIGEMNYGFQIGALSAWISCERLEQLSISVGSRSSSLDVSGIRQLNRDIGRFEMLPGVSCRSRVSHAE